jgi:hypothetical protein
MMLHHSLLQRRGDFYFGGYPLHFAVCSNDVGIFDLVLSFSSEVQTNSDTYVYDMQPLTMKNIAAAISSGKLATANRLKRKSGKDR